MIEIRPILMIVIRVRSIQICSPDTDVFVLSPRRYYDLFQDTSFVTGTGTNHRVIRLNPIVQAIGESIVAALTAFYTHTGADNTGSLAGKENYMLEGIQRCRP